jgi:cellulose synthase/poly-beta-1,6-N-acetylglucosamine synthase-like glycosyltransferase
MTVGDLGLTAFSVFYTIVLAIVALYGLHRWALVFLYYRHRDNKPTPAGEFAELPHVTIQLPMFNESTVARRIIEKTCEIDYPREKLQIQVLDDSTDDTVEIASKAVEEARAKGFDVEYIHRTDRGGFKAGALTNGLKTAKGEFVSIFDADFVPEKDCLRKSIQYFTDPKVCVVQTRWEHLNRHDSLLTRSQAIILDGHFIIEHVARNRSERFMSFNGTAGTWRRSAIDDAGGWEHDTLTEDLDLSYRAQMKGWKFVFLPELIAPAELPPEMNAFKAQQFRWTKGGAQVALKLLPKVMRSTAPLKVKVEAFFHLTSCTMHMYMLLMVLMLFPAVWLRLQSGEETSIARVMFDMSVFSMATLSAMAFYMAGQRELFGDWKSALKYLPALMAIGAGLCVSNTKAIIEAFFGKQSEFVRTPKYGAGRGVSSEKPPARRKRKLLPYVELLMGLYMVFCGVLSVVDPRYMLATPFLVLFAFGFFYVSVLSFLAQRASQLARQQAAAAAA